MLEDEEVLSVAGEGVYLTTKTGRWFGTFDRHAMLLLSAWDRYVTSMDARSRIRYRLSQEEIKEARKRFLANPPVVQIDWQIDD
jgi:hypothetical protein